MSNETKQESTFGVWVGGIILGIALWLTGQFVFSWAMRVDHQSYSASCNSAVLDYETEYRIKRMAEKVDRLDHELTKAEDAKEYQAQVEATGKAIADALIKRMQ